MKFNADSVFFQGYSHRICEDYALTGVVQKGHAAGTPYVVLSDGCSSSPNTDVGARIMCYVARKILNDLAGVENIGSLGWEPIGWRVATEAMNCATMMGADTSCLDATLLMAFPFQKGICVIMYGDGCLYARRKDSQRMEYMDISYANNCPFYPIYFLEQRRKQQHAKIVGELGLTITGSFTPSMGREDGKGKVCPPHYPLIWHFDADAYDLVAISSDGMTSFLKMEDHAPLHHLQMGLDLLGFKGTNGDFLKRRLSKRLKQLKVECDHYDDLSMGAILIEETTDGKDN